MFVEIKRQQLWLRCNVTMTTGHRRFSVAPVLCAFAGSCENGNNSLRMPVIWRFRLWACLQQGALCGLLGGGVWPSCNATVFPEITKIYSDQNRVGGNDARHSI